MNNDPLARFLTASAACPSNVFELRSQLTAAGAKLRPTLVANRGFHNPKNNPQSVQMMLFEIVSGRLDALGIEIKDGEFFFGHFITTNGTSLKAGQGQREIPAGEEGPLFAGAVTSALLPS